MKKWFIALGALIAVLAGFGIQQHRITELRAERDSYKRNTETLLSEVDTFRTANGELAAKVSELELTKKDFERLMAEDAAMIRSLKRRNEELDRLVKSELNSEVKFETVIKEVPVYRDTTTKINRVEWADLPWASFRAEWDEGGVMSAAMTFHDEVDVAVFLKYKRFLWWKTKVIGGTVDVVSRSPYTTSIKVNATSIR